MARRSYFEGRLALEEFTHSHRHGWRGMRADLGGGVIRLVNNRSRELRLRGVDFSHSEWTDVAPFNLHSRFRVANERRHMTPGVSWKARSSECCVNADS